jgi:hypothetical protein
VNPLARKQFELNQTTAGNWQSFAGHRQRVTALLVNAAKGGRLCVLGAGNCNDLDLPALSGAFEEVVLVDLDSEALVKGTISQPLQVADRLRCHGNTDVTGVLERIATWSPSTALNDEDLTALTAGAEVSSWPTGSGFDVVASTCLLSQLVGSLTHSLTDRHPQFLDAVKAIRMGHLWTVAALLRPGGRAVLISDVVSSDTLPGLLAVSDAVDYRLLDHGLVSKNPATLNQPADAGIHRDASIVNQMVSAAIKAGNFFTGLNPAVVHGLFKSAPMFEDVAFIPPWIWRCGQRAYAVYAIEATRAG